MWSSLLKNTDDTLENRDDTRDGVMQFLDGFKEVMEKCYSNPPLEFDCPAFQDKEIANVNMITKAPGEKETLSPYLAHFQELESFKERDPNILIAMPIRNVQHSPDTWDRLFRSNLTNYITEEMATCRYVIITKSRLECLREMDELVLDTFVEQDVCSFFYDWVEEVYYHAEMTTGEQFDNLFAYTFFFHGYDSWKRAGDASMADLVNLVKKLAKLWRNLLKNDDEKLGIDGKYTRPGVIQFLQYLKEDIEASDPSFKFNFQKLKWKACVDAGDHEVVSDNGPDFDMVKAERKTGFEFWVLNQEKLV